MTIKTRVDNVFQFIVLLGVAIVSSQLALAAIPGIPPVVDATLPNPTNIRAYADDRVATITWDPPANAASRNIVGYYVLWGTNGVYTYSKQTQYSIAQIQPLTNGVPYTVKVQSIQGSVVQAPSPGAHGGNSAPEYRANGKVSSGINTTVTATSARVDALRTQMTGFFDDFNIAEGAFDELKWNQATGPCAEPGYSGAFINNQFHSHNNIRSPSNCDRGMITSRPRAVFDITDKTEANPGVVVMDLDGITHGRDVWYIDFIPITARTNGAPLDTTSHNSVFDDDTSDPSQLRFVLGHEGGRMMYYGANKAPVPITPTVRCPDWETGGFNLGWCRATQQISPFPAAPLFRDEYPNRFIPVPNVRHQWRWELSDTKLKVYVNNYKLYEANMPAEFSSKKKYYVQLTQFSYNTGKDDPTNPTTSMLHWDNFGFNGPAPATVTHNYMEGGSTGTVPYLGLGTVANRVPNAPRTTIIPIPDPIATPQQARLHFSLATTGSSWYTWKSSDHIMINGVRYNYPEPRNSMLAPVIQQWYGPAYGDSTSPFPDTIIVNNADLRQGSNTVQLNIGSGNSNMLVYNVHMELDYAQGSQPSYTQPTTIFGKTLMDAAVMPTLSAHDNYVFVEQDMGLPSGGQTHQMPPDLPGDLNSDGAINLFDLMIIVLNIGKTPFEPKADLNGDNRVDTIDLTIGAQYVRQG